MRILIVEDNAFNAYCLRRLLESMSGSIGVTIASNSHMAMAQVSNSKPDLVIIDGELSDKEEITSNGPALADLLLSKLPKLPLIAWTDSLKMKERFSKVFRQHRLPHDEHTMWPKTVGLEHITKTLMYYFSDAITGQNTSYSTRTKREAWA